MYLNHLTSTKQPYWQARIGRNLEAVNSEEVKEEEMDQMQTCDICKEKLNTVEIRQSDDLRCDKCVENPSEKLRDRETSSNREDNEIAELRAVTLMYQSLLRKVKIKLKNSKGAQRVNVKWLGSLQELKDFVTLVLKKTGTWQETRRKASST